MSTKFFNNDAGNTLFDKFKGIASEMTGFDKFLAVVGFFRSSGYFKLRKELEGVSEIKILVGINIDSIFRKHNKSLMMFPDEEKAKKSYDESFRRDIIEANYAPEVEEGLLQMLQDLKEGRLRMRIHATKNLHAKFYLCLPKKHSPNSDGWVIMGSSNISDSGLGTSQPPRYELNVAMKDYDDVKYCSDEFEKLWEAGVPLTAEDIAASIRKTYLGDQPTPFEIYIKVLIEIFGDQVEDDFSIQLPTGVKDLKYQKDAVIQGYQMLMQHNGLFLADVVGLGKTLIATMIAKRFIEANGKNTNVLVVYPPALEENWKSAFELFSISRRAQFISNGSLDKVLDGKDQYRDKEEFDLIIVDEAHGFRSDSSQRYDQLQKICKSACSNEGLLKSTQKKVMLLSATPINNRPDDLQNQLLLFQNSQTCTIDGIPNLKAFFSPLIQKYEKLMKERDSRDVNAEVDEIYDTIREKVIDKVTIRRTRNNILNDADYSADIKSQGIVFPNILPPNDLNYQMGEATSKLFYETLSALSDEQNPKHLHYARYRGVEFLKPEFRRKYANAEQIGQTLAGVYRVLMVKRLESSFYAFKKSLQTLLDITNGMIEMFAQNKVIIARDLHVKEQQQKGLELDQIIENALKKGKDKDDFLYEASNFDPDFIEMLESDKAILEDLIAKWSKENSDPKFDLFCKKMKGEFFDSKKNAAGKLVVFSESVDTLKYLYERVKKSLNRDDVLLVTSENRSGLQQTVTENFDANYPADAKRYNVILTSDVLSEGVNLHRSNVIVNYDSPWNATRLMQRIGRVNRIGSVADNIHNYMFYPSQQGDKEIQLYKNALIKLQSFHSAFGEDAQIFSREEIVKQFQIFNSNVRDAVDKKIKLLREVRDLYNNDRELYHKIKALPLKSRVLRKTGKHSGKSLVFISSNVKTEFFLAEDKKMEPIGFLEAASYLKAKPEEKAVPFKHEKRHYDHVKRALEKYQSEHIEATSVSSVINGTTLDKTSLEAKKFLRTIQQISGSNELKSQCEDLKHYIDEGVYAQLPKELKNISRKSKYKDDREKMKQEESEIQKEIIRLHKEYRTLNTEQRKDLQEVGDPQIIISETFL